MAPVKPLKTSLRKFKQTVLQALTISRKLLRREGAQGPASASGGLPQLPHRGRGLLAWTEDEQKAANIGAAGILAIPGLYGKSRDSPISPPM